MLPNSRTLLARDAADELDYDLVGARTQISTQDYIELEDCLFMEPQAQALW